MKGKHVSSRLSKTEKLAVTLASLAALFLISALLMPAPQAAHALAGAPAAAAAPAAPDPSNIAPKLIAAYTALFPLISAAYIPLLAR